MKGSGDIFLALSIHLFVFLEFDLVNSGYKIIATILIVLSVRFVDEQRKM